MTNIKCPVCGYIIAGNVCDNCGYVRIVFPKTVPDSISGFEQERVDVLKKISKRNSTQLTESQRLTDSEKSRADRLDRELEEFKKRNSRLESECHGLTAENGRLSQEVKAQSSEISILETDLAEATDRLKNLAGNQQASAFLLFNDGDDFTVYPIVGNAPVFFASGPGCAKGLGNREGVVLLPVITGVEIAFEIRPEERGFRIIDYCRTLRREGMPVRGEEKLINKDSLSFAGAPFKAYFTLRSRRR